MKLTMNPQRNGVELRFDAKPSAAIRTLMKEHRFRFTESTGDPRWYAKATTDNVAFAKNLLAATEPGKTVVLDNPPPGGWKPADNSSKPCLEFV